MTKEPKAAATALTLHIGGPKTGTCSLQGFLALNRQAFFAASGTRYPFAGNLAKADQGRVTAGNGAVVARLLRSGQPDRVAEGLARLASLLAAQSGPMLLSSEAFWSCSNETFTRLAAALDGRTPLKVIFYARAQVANVRSAYLQSLGRHGPGRSLAEFFEGMDHAFRPGARTAFLDSLLGRDNVMVRKYDRDSLVGGDIVDDFLSAFGLSVGPGFSRLPPANPSFDAEHYLYARLSSRHPGGVKSARRSLAALANRGDLAGLYGRGRAITGLQVMDAATARRITEARAEDNALLDALRPGVNLDLDADNRRAVAALEAEADASLAGLSRLQLLLLDRVVDLEAQLEALSVSPRLAAG